LALPKSHLHTRSSIAPMVFQTSSQQTLKQESATASRSTSAGSRNTEERDRPVSVLPEYEYPVPFVVRNTFIEMQIRHASLDEFFHERRIHSSPAVPNENEDSEEEREDEDASPLSFERAEWKSPEHQHLSCTMSASTQAFMTSMAAVTSFWTRPYHDTAAVPADNFLSPQQEPCIIRLSNVLQGPVLGSNELPTVGSEGHHMGACKPCAFYYTKGCGNGTQCSFCHLCPPEEKRMRQKDKKEAFREMRRQRKQVRL